MRKPHRRDLRVVVNFAAALAAQKLSNISDAHRGVFNDTAIRRIQEAAQQRGLTLEQMLDRLKRDPVYAQEFAVLASRQGLPEKLVADVLAMAFGDAVTQLPQKNNPHAVYMVQRDDQSVFIYKKDLREGEATVGKALDFLLVWGDTVWFMAHKHTTGTGGGQDNQWSEISRQSRTLTADASHELDQAVLPDECDGRRAGYIGLVDGDYYTHCADATGKAIKTVTGGPTVLQAMTAAARTHREHTGALSYATPTAHVVQLLARLAPGAMLGAELAVRADEAARDWDGIEAGYRVEVQATIDAACEPVVCRNCGLSRPKWDVGEDQFCPACGEQLLPVLQVLSAA